MIQLTHKTNTMRLILLSLMGLVMVAETFETFQSLPPLRRIFYVLPNRELYDRISGTQRIMMMKMGGHDMPPLGMGSRRPPIIKTHRTSLAPSRGPPIPPPTPYLPPHGQTNKPSQDDDSFSSFNPSHNLSPPAVNQDHNPSSFGQGTKPSTVNDKVFFPEPKPEVSNQQHKPSVSVQGFNTPSFNPSHELFSAQDFKPSSEEVKKSSSSDEDHKPSSFGQGDKSIDKDIKTPMFDTQGSHPDRNPACNILPDPGTCRAALPRYYLDPETGTCNCYLYGGCTEDGEGESQGSFFTLAECQRECHPPSLEEGFVCKEIFKEDQFVSFLADPLPTKNTQTDHLNDEEFLASFYK